MAVMPLTVSNHDAFDPEYDKLPEAVQDELLAMMGLLERYGPQLGRPQADTLNGSKHKNMKELRFKAGDGVWRVARGVRVRSRAASDPAGCRRQGWGRTDAVLQEPDRHRRQAVR